MFVSLLTIGVVVLAAGILPVEKTLAAGVPLSADQAPIVYDIFYLLPVLALPGLGGAGVLALLVLIFGVLFIVPWLPRKKHRYVNVAFVTPENCTGCQLCAIDCPFDAIVMVEGANPNPRNKELAVVNDDKCAECGICVGACPFHAINLPLAGEDMIRDKVVALLS
jgi:ferredoxin